MVTTFDWHSKIYFEDIFSLKSLRCVFMAGWLLLHRPETEENFCLRTSHKLAQKISVYIDPSGMPQSIDCRISCAHWSQSNQGHFPDVDVVVTTFDWHSKIYFEDIFSLTSLSCVFMAGWLLLHRPETVPRTASMLRQGGPEIAAGSSVPFIELIILLALIASTVLLALNVAAGGSVILARRLQS